MLTVGTLTVLDPELFPDQTVWSSYGAGYGWLPLVLPFVGLAWLWHTRPRDLQPADHSMHCQTPTARRSGWISRSDGPDVLLTVLAAYFLTAIFTSWSPRRRRRCRHTSP